MTGNEVRPVLAVIGGSGKEGRGLAYRWLKAGYGVIIGSRVVEKAEATALELVNLTGRAASVSGASNIDAAARASIVILAVPFSAHAAILASIRPAMGGKLLIDACVPLSSDNPAIIQRPAAGSAAQESRAALGEATEIAAAFHTISHHHFFRDDPIDCDVLVTGTTANARATALALVAAAGLRGWDAGALENSAVTEGLTSVLIHINKTHKSKNAGIRITGAEHKE